MTPVSSEPIWLARRILWLSPPDRLGRGAVQGQVREAHVEQEAQARADLLEQLGRDLRVGALELQGVEEGEGVRDGEAP